MSLNYDLTKIENYAELQAGTVQCICFGAMFIGMPRIEEGGKCDWMKFATRLHAWEKVAGCLSTSDKPMNAEVVKRFIGLCTNASPMTDAQFAKKLAEVAMTDARRAVNRDLKGTK